MQASVIRILVAFLIIMLSASIVQGQMKLGDNPTNIHPDAILDMESTNKGMLLPRIALTSTNSASPLSAFTTGMTIYNTATSGTGSTAVTPGIYYSDGMQWVRSGTANATTVVQRIEYTATQGQLNFTTPLAITDINKVALYRNGVLINCTMVGNTTVTAEVPCEANDNVKIIQQL